MAKKSLTVKETKLIKATVAGKKQKEAGLYADPNRGSETARVWANETLRKPTVQEALQKELNRQGITLAKVVKPIKDGLEAEKVAIVGNGDSAMAEITPDHAIRLKASSMAQQLMGLNKAQSDQTTYNFTQVINTKNDKYND